MNDDRKTTALDVTKQLFGRDMDLSARAGEPAAAADLRRLMHEHAFADSWTRTALDARTRSIATVTMAAALGWTDELRAHTLGALHLGVTPEELIDVFIHVGVYAGVVRGAGAWAQVSDLVSDRKARPASRTKATEA
jgi:4-carboxymuconolactone decarboxylase